MCEDRQPRLEEAGFSISAQAASDQPTTGDTQASLRVMVPRAEGGPKRNSVSHVPQTDTSLGQFFLLAGIYPLPPTLAS